MRLTTNIPGSLALLTILFVTSSSYAQDLYSARGYWQETHQPNYQKVKDKQTRGDSLTVNEKAYLQDFESYLSTYYQRLSPDEKQKYEQLKTEWDRELAATPPPKEEEFEWRGRDRVVNTLYGIWYGVSLVVIADWTDSEASVGIPLITGGAWLLGPVINPKKYEGITLSTVRANNSGKFLGLLYGASLGLAIGGESDDADKWILGGSTIGSITLGEIGFQMQKKRNFSDGHIEMIRHYGVLGPWLGYTGAVAAGGGDNANAVGASLLAGGTLGLVLGNKAAKRYDYTRGDVDAISSLTWISTGVGLTVVAQYIDEGESEGLILIPAAGSILGTMLGQKAVRGAHFTKKQGSALNLATAGAALVGVGVSAIAEFDSPVLTLAVPTGLALITHQIVFTNYKKKNLMKDAQGSHRRRHNYNFSMKVMPENYFFNQRIPVQKYSPEAYTRLINPLIKFKLSFN